MSELQQIETLLQEAIALLLDGGFPSAAESLSDQLRGIREAPTAGARRRRIAQLGDLFDGIGSACHAFRLQAMDGTCTASDGMHGFRFSRTDAHRQAERRYRRTIAELQQILAGAQAA